MQLLRVSRAKKTLFHESQNHAEWEETVLHMIYLILCWLNGNLGLQGPFTTSVTFQGQVIPAGVRRDSRVSWKALCLLSLHALCPSSWKFSTSNPTEALAAERFQNDYRGRQIFAEKPAQHRGQDKPRFLGQ